jgi:hypothetical protein
LLIPEKYKKDEGSILNIFEENQKADAKDSNIGEKFKIIYTRSNQKLFSYELDVNPNDGNLVKDPIVRVVTENNGTAWDYGVIIGTAGNPIKIKANSSSNLEKFIRLKLKETGLEKYVDKISPADEGVVFEVNATYKLLAFIIGGLIILLIAISAIIIQNIYCYFEQYKKHLAIMQLHGYKFIDKYKGYLMLSIINWVMIFLVQCYMRGINIKIQIILIVIFMFFELLITLLTIKFVSKRKIVSIIKGSL